MTCCEGFQKGECNLGRDHEKEMELCGGGVDRAYGHGYSARGRIPAEGFRLLRQGVHPTPFPDQSGQGRAFQEGDRDLERGVGAVQSRTLRRESEGCQMEAGSGPGGVQNRECRAHHPQWEKSHGGTRDPGGDPLRPDGFAKEERDRILHRSSLRVSRAHGSDRARGLRYHPGLIH